MLFISAARTVQSTGAQERGSRRRNTERRTTVCSMIGIFSLAAHGTRNPEMNLMSGLIGKVLHGLADQNVPKHIDLFPGQ